ncbi:MAG TPA: hypothetical protein DEA22_00700 [Blastocatellia bacterium]|nr:hypothetical protein [Blastocatellia bacterium]
MEFRIEDAVSNLSATPAAVRAMVGGLKGEMAQSSGKRDDWAPYDIIGHLIYCEIADWIPRARIILEQGSNRTFEPFDRYAQFERSEGKTLADLIEEFDELRKQNLATLLGWQLSANQLKLEGIHPELGPVTLGQLIATWSVHDLNHIRQIASSIARRYSDDVGAWREYLSILN